MNIDARLRSRSSWLVVLVVLAALASACGSGGSSSSNTAGAVRNDVYFVGYVYDGATGKRLAASDLTAISIKYRDQVINVKIEDDGRFVSTDPLPTWQDYSVYIGASGYRPFVSNNPGFDVPKSLQMTASANQTSTVQTFEFVARLFPAALQAPAVSLTIEKSDAQVTIPPPARATGTLRLTPASDSVIQQGSDPFALQGSTSTARTWFNDEDLDTQTITQAFTDGVAQIDAGKLLYGVSYEIAVFGVDGYQPFPSSGSTSSSVLTAGAVTSLSLTLQLDAKAPLRILSTDADKCVVPSPTSTTYGATIDLTFSEEIEPAGPTFAEDIDDGVTFTVGSSSSSSFCPLNASNDPTKQERGTMAIINGKVLTLSFNPSIGLSTITQYGTTCVTPPAFTAIVYGNLSNVFVQPKGDAVRKASIGSMLPPANSFPSSSVSLSCPSHVATTSSF